MGRSHCENADGTEGIGVVLIMTLTRSEVYSRVADMLPDAPRDVVISVVDDIVTKQGQHPPKDDPVPSLLLNWLDGTRLAFDQTDFGWVHKSDTLQIRIVHLEHNWWTAYMDTPVQCGPGMSSSSLQETLNRLASTYLATVGKNKTTGLTFDEALKAYREGKEVVRERKCGEDTVVICDSNSGLLMRHMVATDWKIRSAG